MEEDKFKEILEEIKKNPEIIQRLQMDILKSSNSLVDNLKLALGINFKRTQEESNLLDFANKINQAIKKRVSDFNDLNLLSKEFNKNQALAQSSEIQNKILREDLDNLALSQVDSTKKVIQEIKTQEEIINRINEQKDLGYTADQNAIEAAQAVIFDKEKELTDSLQELGIKQKTLLFSELNTEELKKQNSLLDKQKKVVIDAQKNLKPAKFASEFLSNFKGIKSIAEEAFNKTKESNDEIVKATGKSQSIFKINQDFIKNFGNGLIDVTKGFATIVFIANELFQALLLADKELVELQKSFALSRSEAMGLRMELASAAAASGNLNVTTSKLLESVTQLSTQFGFIARFSNETLVTMTKLTQQVGLAADAAGTLAAESVLIEGSFDQIYKDTLAASYELQQQTGVQFDLRKILEATANVTGQVRANLAANPIEIAKAVTQAKLFGAELDDINGAAQALLQFEDSIRNELQAELLIGRDLNLERARAAALVGDQVTVAQELAKQAADFTQFQRLNVLQQDALASSLGLTSDRLADILFQQEIQNKTARELRELGKDDLANRLEAQTAADQFNKTVDKLKGIFADVGTAFFPILQLLGDAFKIVNLIVAPITDLVQLLVAIPRSLMGVEDAFSSISFATPRAFGFEDSIDDGIIPPSGEGSILSRPEGSIKLNPNDTVIAGTDLFGDRMISQMPDYQNVLNETNIQSPSIQQENLQATTINQNFDEFVSRLDKVEAAINNQTKILAKGQETIAKTKTKLTVGATDFGTELNVNSFRIQ